MRAIGQDSAALAAALIVAASMALSAPVRAQQAAPPPPQCQTIGGTTYCKDGTQFDQTQAGQPEAAAAADGKPLRTNIGPSGPTEYQVDNTRIFGVEDRLRRLGERNVKTGQQEGPGTYSGRNCAVFNTSIVCD